MKTKAPFHVDLVAEARKDIKQASSRMSRGMLLGSLVIACGYVLGSWLHNEPPA